MYVLFGLGFEEKKKVFLKYDIKNRNEKKKKFMYKYSTDMNKIIDNERTVV